MTDTNVHSTVSRTLPPGKGTGVRSVITLHEVNRRKAGKSLTKLASEIGVSRSYSSRIEAGLIPASDRYRRGYARACGVSVNEVFDPTTGRVQ